MSSTTSIWVSEYLNSSYSPDRDFVDGRVEERNAGEHDHAAVQAALVLWFGQHQPGRVELASDYPYREWIAEMRRKGSYVPPPEIG